MSSITIYTHKWHCIHRKVKLHEALRFDKPVEINFFFLHLSATVRDKQTSDRCFAIHLDKIKLKDVAWLD